MRAVGRHPFEAEVGAMGDVTGDPSTCRLLAGRNGAGASVYDNLNPNSTLRGAGLGAGSARAAVGRSRHDVDAHAGGRKRIV